MSHFSKIKTSFKNLKILKKSLENLTINECHDALDFFRTSSEENSLIALQKNDVPISFVWNENEYELVVDLAFWNQPFSLESFLNQLSQKYANSIIIHESSKQGFGSVSEIRQKDGSVHLVLQRWV
jgi:hypothetical protein